MAGPGRLELLVSQVFMALTVGQFDSKNFISVLALLRFFPLQ